MWFNPRGGRTAEHAVGSWVILLVVHTCASQAELYPKKEMMFAVLLRSANEQQ